MTKRRLAIWIALPLVLGAAIAAALLFAPMRSSAPPKDEGPGVGKAALADLQSEATEACKCARVMTNAKGMKACWTHFNKRVEKLPRGVQASACDPIAEQGMCFGNGDCVVTGYAVNGKGGLLCTSEEARTAEAIWNAAVRSTGRAPLPAAFQFRWTDRPVTIPLLWRRNLQAVQTRGRTRLASRQTPC